MLMNPVLKNLHTVPLPGQKEEEDLTQKDLAKVVCVPTCIVGKRGQEIIALVLYEKTTTA